MKNNTFNTFPMDSATELEKTSQIQKSIFQFQKDIRDEDRNRENKAIVLDKDMEKYFLPKKQKAYVSKDKGRLGLFSGYFGRR